MIRLKHRDKLWEDSLTLGSYLCVECLNLILTLVSTKPAPILGLKMQDERLNLLCRLWSLDGHINVDPDRWNWTSCFCFQWRDPRGSAELEPTWWRCRALLRDWWYGCIHPRGKKRPEIIYKFYQSKHIAWKFGESILIIFTLDLHKDGYGINLEPHLFQIKTQNLQSRI